MSRFRDISKQDFYLFLNTRGGGGTSYACCTEVSEVVLQRSGKITTENHLTNMLGLLGQQKSILLVNEGVPHKYEDISHKLCVYLGQNTF